MLSETKVTAPVKESVSILTENQDMTIKLALEAEMIPEMCKVLEVLMPFAFKCIGVDLKSKEEREQEMRSLGWKPLLAEDDKGDVVLQLANLPKEKCPDIVETIHALMPLILKSVGVKIPTLQVTKAPTERAISESDEELTGEEIFDKFIDGAELYGTEGEGGLDNLNEIAKTLGYEASGYKYGSSLESFLADNSGCVEAIRQWIGETVDSVDEWREMLKMEDAPENE